MQKRKFLLNVIDEYEQQNCFACQRELKWELQFIFLNDLTCNIVEVKVHIESAQFLCDAIKLFLF